MISDHAEHTFVLLRYSLGGDRPSQTQRVTEEHEGVLSMVGNHAMSVMAKARLTAR